MRKHTLFLSTLALGLVLAACGSVHNYVVVEPDNVAALEDLAIAPAEVSSKEQNPDALALNEELEAMAAEELKSALGSRATSGTAHGAVNCRISVVYGNRALRYWVGFGAGAGHMIVDLELRDSSDKVRLATRSESDLAVGMFGGNMREVARETIQEAVAEFAAQL